MSSAYYLGMSEEDYRERLFGKIEDVQQHTQHISKTVDELSRTINGEDHSLNDGLVESHKKLKVRVVNLEKFRSDDVRTKAFLTTIGGAIGAFLTWMTNLFSK